MSEWDEDKDKDNDRMWAIIKREELISTTLSVLEILLHKDKDDKAALARAFDIAKDLQDMVDAKVPVV